MKTDVIFLGAGASVGAGFPDNRELANYVIDGFGEGLIERVLRPISQLRAQLRRTNLLSVDEFCQITKDEDEVLQMKRIARLALIDYPLQRSKKRWNSTDNPYRSFIDSLFLPSSQTLDPRFTVVNFNYDGLLAKLLVDAVTARHEQSRTVEAVQDEAIAAVSGGYVHDPPSGEAHFMSLTPEVQEKRFCHFMPHGTITVVSQNGRLYSEEHQIYGNTPWRLGDAVSRGMALTPMIDFPWETDDRVSKAHRMQLSTISFAVRAAKRIHFIGLAGHHLLRPTLQRTFTGLEKEAFATKKWFVATKDSDPQRVFWNLCDCFLPQTFQRDITWRMSLKAEPVGSFEDWLYKRPHCPVDEIQRQSL